jgi:undecaprenyl-diphosphatase
MTHLTYVEAAVVGLVQGISEMFPVSSLGHNVLIPALVGGSWARDLNVSASESPYLAFVVGLHVATAIALLLYFWRDWLKIIGGFFSSIRDRQVRTAEQKLAWLIILATVPVAIAGLLFEHEFRVIFGRPIVAGVFLAVNGLILLAGERWRSRESLAADAAIAKERSSEAGGGPTDRDRARRHELVTAGGGTAQQQAEPESENAGAPDHAQGIRADRRLAGMSYGKALVVGCVQTLALLAGISRDGVTMVAGMARGLSRQDAARFAFLLATPAILGAGVLKVPDLLGPLGSGIRGPVLLGSVLSGLGAYFAVRFLLRYLRTRTLIPFGIYCLVAGAASVA